MKMTQRAKAVGADAGRAAIIGTVVALGLIAALTIGSLAFQAAKSPGYATLGGQPTTA